MNGQAVAGQKPALQQHLLDVGSLTFNLPSRHSFVLVTEHSSSKTESTYPIIRRTAFKMLPEKKE